MPQIQILPSAPSFGSRLAQALAGAGANVAEGFAKRTQNRNDQKILEGFNPESSSMDLISQYGKLSPESQKNLQPLVNTFLQNKGKLEVEGLRQNQKNQQLQQKEQAKQAEEQKAQAEWQDIFKNLEENNESGALQIPFFKSMLGWIDWDKLQENREAFDVMAFQLERYARAAHTKGALSTKVYQSLLSKLPGSKYSQSQNRGRVKAWKEVLLKDPNTPDDLNVAEPEKTWVISPAGNRVQIPNDQVEAALSSQGRPG